MHTRRRLFAAVLLAAVVCGALTFPRGWGARLVERLARRALQDHGWPRATLSIASISPWRLTTGPLSLGSAPDSIHARQLVATYSPGSLWRHEIPALRVDGLRMTVLSGTNGPTLAGIPSARAATPPAATSTNPPSTSPNRWSWGTLVLADLRVDRQSASASMPGATLAEGTLALTPDGHGRHQIGGSGTLFAAPAALSGWVDLHAGDATLEASLGPAELGTVQARVAELLPTTNSVPALAGLGRLQGRAAFAHGTLDECAFSVAADRLTVSTASAGATIQPVDLSALMTWVPGRPRAALHLRGAGTLQALKADALPAGLTDRGPIPIAGALQLIPAADGWMVSLRANAQVPLIASEIGASPTGLELAARGRWPGEAATAEPWRGTLALRNFTHHDGGLVWSGDSLQLDAELSIAPASPPQAHGTFTAAGLDVQAGDAFSLSNATAHVGWAWDSGNGLSITGAPALTWTRASAAGLDLQGGPLQLSGTGTTFAVAMPLTIAGSAVHPLLRAEVRSAPAPRATLDLQVPPTPIATGDALLHLSATIAAAESCEGSLAASASLDWQPGSPTRVTANVSLRDVSAVSSNAHWSVHGLTTDIRHASTLPLRHFPTITTHFGDLSVAGITIDGGQLQWRWQPGEFFVERADLAWCGGWLRAYALRIDTAHPNPDCVLYVDRLDLGRLLKVLRVLDSEGTGILYGRVPLRYEHGRVFLSEGFLYSLPGQGGTLSIKDTRVIEDTLVRSGLKAEVRKNVLAALRGLRYSVFRVDLKPGAATDSELHVTIAGDAAQKGLPPVDLDLNVRGPLENLLNLGLQVNKVGH